jgi:hypothetical protein
MNRIWAGFLFLALAGPAAAELPARLEIVYECSATTSRSPRCRLARVGNGSTGSSSAGAAGDLWLLELRAPAGAWSAGRPAAERIQRRAHRPRPAHVRFDWKSNVMTSLYKRKTRTEPMPPNAQDRISFVLALALAPAGTRALDVNLADGRGVSHHVYDFLRRERVTTPVGEFDALVVGRSSDDQRLEIWLAAALGNMPVRILVVEKGDDRFDQFAIRIAR